MCTPATEIAVNFKTERIDWSRPGDGLFTGGGGGAYGDGDIHHAGRHTKPDRNGDQMDGERSTLSEHDKNCLRSGACR